MNTDNVELLQAMAWERLQYWEERRQQTAEALRVAAQEAHTAEQQFDYARVVYSEFDLSCNPFAEGLMGDDF